jgi:hypothetical protein
VFRLLTAPWSRSALTLTPLPLERTVGVMVDLRVRGQSRLVRELLQPLA